MKAHVGTDTGKGLEHSVVVTDTAVHDLQLMNELIHGEEQVIYGDKAYSNTKKQQENEDKGIKWCVTQRGSWWYQMIEEEVARNHRQSQVRAKVEHVFLVVQHLWHYQKVSYKGLYKNAVQVYILFTLAYIYLVRRELIMTRV